MAQISKNSEFEISSEFIESGKSLQTKPKKKGGPYSKAEIIKRRKEVYKLYFEYDYSARQIAEMLNVNRNTINEDVRSWYKQIIINSNTYDPEPIILINIQRFKIQRLRLRENLDTAKNFQERNTIEKMIFQIDSKIIQIQIKLAETKRRMDDVKIDFLNQWCKENGKDNRFMTQGDKLSLSEKTFGKLIEMVREDRYRPQM